MYRVAARMCVIPFGTSPFQPGPVIKYRAALLSPVRVPGLAKIVIQRSTIGNR